MTQRDELRVQKALQGAEFPADKPALLTYAQTRAADDETLEALRGLPDGEFASIGDVVDAVPPQPEGDRPGGTERLRDDV